MTGCLCCRPDHDVGDEDQTRPGLLLSVMSERSETRINTKNTIHFLFSYSRLESTFSFYS